MQRYTLFSIGYESKEIKEFVSSIKKKGVDIVVDVRELPWSRKNGFSKKHLRETFKKNSINYVNFPELGSPGPIRKKYKVGGSSQEFFNKYKGYLNHLEEDLMDLLSLIKIKNVCIMCYEKDAEKCHRKIIIGKIRSMNGVIDVVNI